MPRAGASLLGVSGLLDAIDDIQDRWTASATYRVGANAEYAVYVEFGTSSQAAQPYLRPAAEHARRNIGRWAADANSLEDLVETVALEIERFAKTIVPVDTGTLRASIKAEKVGSGSSATRMVSI